MESVKQNATPIGVVLIAVGGIGFVGMAMSFVICNLTSRKFKGKSEYNYAKYGTTKDD